MHELCILILIFAGCVYIRSHLQEKWPHIWGKPYEQPDHLRQMTKEQRTRHYMERTCRNEVSL